MSEYFDDGALRAAYAPRLRERATTDRAECPGEDALLAAIRGEGSEAERLRVLDHALQCSACRPELALLRAVTGPEARERPVVRIESWRRFVPAAAAAGILLAVGLFGIDRWRERGDSGITRAPMNAGAPALIAPSSGSVLGAGPVTFVWHPVTGARQYTVEVSTADGTSVFTSSTADTVIAAPLGGAAHGELRWWVRAHMDDGAELRSEARVVRVP